MADSVNIMDLIVRRTSTRTFTGKPLSQNQINAIIQFISMQENQRGLFDYVTFELIENKNNTIFGAYGDISGATHYIAVVAKNNRTSLMDVGYAFERLMLFAESLGLGTCWLAATSFDRNAAEMHTYLSDGEIIAAISPIGEKANKTNSK